MYLPSLRTVELGYNRLRSLVTEQGPQSTPLCHSNAMLHSINLDGNNLDSFSDVCSAMRSLLGWVRLAALLPNVSVIRHLQHPTTGAHIKPHSEHTASRHAARWTVCGGLPRR